MPNQISHVIKLSLSGMVVFSAAWLGIYLGEHWTLVFLLLAAVAMMTIVPMLSVPGWRGKLLLLAVIAHVAAGVFVIAGDRL
jgi:hypothetical protein